MTSNNNIKNSCFIIIQSIHFIKHQMSQQASARYGLRRNIARNRQKIPDQGYQYHFDNNKDVQYKPRAKQSRSKIYLMGKKQQDIGLYQCAKLLLNESFRTYNQRKSKFTRVQYKKKYAPPQRQQMEQNQSKKFKHKKKIAKQKRNIKKSIMQPIKDSEELLQSRQIYKSSINLDGCADLYQIEEQVHESDSNTFPACINVKIALYLYCSSIYKNEQNQDQQKRQLQILE